MSLPYKDARRIVEAWRALADENRTARTYVALIDSMPEDDPENYAAAVGVLASGIPGQLAELRRLVEAAGAVLDEHFTGRPPEPEPKPEGPDPIAFLNIETDESVPPGYGILDTGAARVVIKEDDPDASG